MPVDCRSNLAHETLGRFMVAAGKLAEQDFTACLGESAARGVPLGEVLVERGLVGAADLFRILQQNLAKKLLDLFTWREGELRLLDERPRRRLLAQGAGAAARGHRHHRFAPQEEVDAGGRSRWSASALALAAEPRFPVDELRLSQRQVLLVEALRPGRRMDELAAATGLPYDEITRLLYALAVLGAVAPGRAVARRSAAG